MRDSSITDRVGSSTACAGSTAEWPRSSYGHRMRRVVLIAAGIASACGGGPAPAPSNTAPRPVLATEPPDLDELRVIVSAYGSFEFDPGAIARGCPEGEMIREYLARLNQYGSPIDDGDVHRLTGGCGEFPRIPGPVDPPRSNAHWFCVIDAYTSDPAGESPWHYELRARIRKVDRTLDLATLACPGQS